MNKKTMSTFTAIIHKEDNLYVAECPEVGTVSQGETIEDVVKNLQEATELYLEEFHPLSESRIKRMTRIARSKISVICAIRLIRDSDNKKILKNCKLENEDAVDHRRNIKWVK